MTNTITAYTTPPQHERKAQRELREARIRAYVPTEVRTYRTGHGKTVKRRMPVAPGYVFAEGKPYDAKHVRGAIGPVVKGEIRSLYVRTSATIRKAAFAVGDAVLVKRGSMADIPGVVEEVRGRRWYTVAFDMLGKRCRSRVLETDIALRLPPTR